MHTLWCLSICIINLQYYMAAFLKMLISWKGWSGREIFSLLIDFPNGHNHQHLARSTPGAWKFICISHMVVGAQILGSSSSAFPGTLAGRWIKGGAANTWIAVHMACRVAGSDLNFATTEASQMHFMYVFLLNKSLSWNHNRLTLSIWLLHLYFREAFGI